MVGDKVAIVVQARMGSTRLPGKVLKTIIDKPSLWHIITRVRRSKRIDKIIIATTSNSEDDSIQSFSEENDVEYFRGDSDDVLSRYYLASLEYNLNTIVRLTADNPLVDPTIIDETVEFYNSPENNSKYDYIRTTNYPIGLNVELFSREALEICFFEAKNSYDREHVTPYFYNNPVMFKIHNLHKEFDHSRYRLTMDTMEDYEKINKIFNYYFIQGNYCFGWKDIKRLIDDKSELI